MSGRRRILLAALGLAIAATVAGPAAADTARATGSPLALPLVSGIERPELVLAQRAIDREWGPSDDSVYVTVSIPDWRSEGWAMALSAAAPGAGQLYVGEGSGLWFALAEVAGWTARIVYGRRAEDIEGEAVKWVGDPADSASRWSFDRLEAGNVDSADLRYWYLADRDVFYEMIAGDPRYAAGWESGTADLRGDFEQRLEQVERHRQRARYAGAAIWINHVVAAVDALRAARTHNLPLSSRVSVRVRSGWRRGSPTLTAALERRF
jgi:hypothetical protein